MRTRTILASLSLAGLLALGGCAAERTPSPTPSASGTTGPSATAEPSPTPTPSATGTSGLTIACADLVTAQTAYDWNPNVAAIASHTPAAGSDAARVASLGGTVCALENLSSGEITEVAATLLAPQDAVTVRADAAGRGAASGLGGEGSFAGTSAWVLVDDGDDAAYWVVVSGPAIVSAADAAPLAQAAVAAL